MLLDSIKVPSCCNVLCNTTLKIVAIYTFVKQCQCFTTDQMIFSMLQQSPFWIDNKCIISAIFVMLLSIYKCYSHPSSNSCSRFSATFARNSGVHTSWLYERLSCFRVGHLRCGSKAKEGPMSFREISRFAIQFIFNK